LLSATLPYEVVQEGERLESDSGALALAVPSPNSGLYWFSYYPTLWVSRSFDYAA